MLPEVQQEAIQATLDITQDQRLGIRWAYYSGNHPRIYMTPKLRETFRNLADSLAENYCGLAVNARLSRLEVTGWEGPQAEQAEAAWLLGGFPQRQDVMFRWGLVHGSAYLIVQDDIMTVNSARVAYAQPDPDDWMDVAWAGKAYISGSRWRAVLWDEEAIYRYDGPEADPTATVVPAGDEFTLADGGERHGYSRVPVFPMNPYGYMAPSLIDQISPVQDRINKLSANKFVAAEFGAFKQRVFFTRQEVDPFELRQQPDHAIVMDPGDSDGRASVQQMDATELRNYDDAKNAEIDSLFTIASLPRHMRVNPGAMPSGEAIKADEGPFVEALRDHQREFGEAIQSAYAMLNMDAEPVWRDVEPHDDLINAQVVSTLVGAGIPWQALASRYLGMSQEEIEQASQAVQVEQSAQAQQTASILQNPSLWS